MLSLARRFVLALVALIGLAVALPVHAADGELQIKDLKVGEGLVAEKKLKATVHYTGWLLDGTKFDSSVDHDRPFTFRIGAGQVIPGWDEGVVGMREGGRRELTIPAHMAYGETGYPPVIPPNATLRFEIELLKVHGPSFTNVSNDQLKELIARGVPVVDIRREDEWKQTGVIEGSKLITAFNAHGRFEQSFINGLVKVAKANEEVILICRTGSRTANLSEALSTQLNYTKIYNVEKGITQWIADGNSVVKSQ